MDVLQYNAGASSANQTLPRSLLPEKRLCKLGCYNASHKSSLPSRPRGQQRRLKLGEVGRRAKALQNVKPVIGGLPFAH
jgi:hypothetical protein